MAPVFNNTFVDVADIQVFTSPREYKQQLLSLISRAKTRIIITALYLQNDDAGQEILHALYQAKQKNSTLEINVFVDFHRAQRGLIGEKESLGNRALYLQLEDQYQHSINIYGVGVKRKELFGVLHLKGMVFDDTLFYTGASINDVYLQQHQRYRLDRYYQIKSQSLCQSFCDYLDNTFVKTGYAPRINSEVLPSLQGQKRNIIRLKSLVKRAAYSLTSTEKSQCLQDHVVITPLVGCGVRHNKLNSQIRKVIQKSQQELLLFTPYFNLPKSLAKDVNKALKRGVKVSIVIGDKTANDFYISPEKPFSTIGIVPYIYEMLLSRYVKKQQKFIDNGLLEIRLWHDEDNSYHLKGIVADNRYHLLTGSNLNPRAWSLDLENGLLLDDASGSLLPSLKEELSAIYKNTTVIKKHQQLDQIKHYPAKPQNLLKKLRMVQIDRILKRFL